MNAAASVEVRSSWPGRVRRSGWRSATSAAAVCAVSVTTWKPSPSRLIWKLRPAASGKAGAAARGEHAVLKAGVSLRNRCVEQCGAAAEHVDHEAAVAGIHAQVVEVLQDRQVADVRGDDDRVGLPSHDDLEPLPGVDGWRPRSQQQRVTPRALAAGRECQPGHRRGGPVVEGHGRGYRIGPGNPHDVALAAAVVEELEDAVREVAVGAEIAVTASGTDVQLVTRVGSSGPISASPTNAATEVPTASRGRAPPVPSVT